MNDSHTVGGALESRRKFLRQASVLGGGAALGGATRQALAAMGGKITLPFDNGERELVAFPQKRPLIVLTSRPPQLETPFAVFNDGVLTRTMRSSCVITGVDSHVDRSQHLSTAAGRQSIDAARALAR